MPEWLLFILEFLAILGTGLTIASGAYRLACLQWIYFSKNCFAVFGKQPSFEKICFLFKENKWKYLIGFYLCLILIPLPFGLILQIWLIFKWNLYYIIGFTVSLILPYVWWYFLMIRFLKKIKEIGVFSKQEAIKQFQEYQRIIIPTLKPIITFKILKNKQKTIRNRPFQFHQKRFNKKIKRLIDKNLLESKENICLLNIFIKYLKGYSNVLKGMEKEFENNGTYYEVEVNYQIYNLNTALPSIVINNFFAFIKASKIKN